MDSVQQEVEVSVTLTKAALKELEMFSQIENTQYFRILFYLVGVLDLNMILLLLRIQRKMILY